MPQKTLTYTQQTCTSKLRIKALVFALIAFSLMLNTGCVFRRMTITSNPPGALVIADGEEVGHTPYTTDFTYYATHEFKLVAPGYETLTIMQDVPAPWYQKPGIDFFSDNLLPFKVTNRQRFHYDLQPQQIVPTNELIDRADSLRSESQLGTQPVTTP